MKKQITQKQIREKTIRETQMCNKKLVDMFERLALDPDMIHFSIALHIHRAYRSEGISCEKLIGYCPSGKYQIWIEKNAKWERGQAISVICSPIASWNLLECMAFDGRGLLNNDPVRLATYEEAKVYILEMFSKKMDFRKIEIERQKIWKNMDKLIASQKRNVPTKPVHRKNKRTV